MLIKDTGAGLGLEDYPLESSLQKLGIVAYNNIPVTDAMLAACQLSINRITKGAGSVVLMYPMSLQAALEIAAANEGNYGSKDLAGLSIIGTIDISNFGTLVLDGDYITISLTHTNGANFGVKFYSLEGGEYSRNSIVYEPNVVLADTPKEIGVSPYYQIALPIANLVKFSIKYTDGRVATYVPDELRMISQDSNDIVSKISTGALWNIVSGYMNYFVLGISMAVSVTVHYTTQTKFFLIKDI